MKKRQILWAIVFGSALAISGCGDDDNGTAGTGGGNGGSGGTAGTGGGNGSGTSTCEAFCNGTCSFGGVVPGDNRDLCVSTCRSEAPEWDDNCGDEATAYFDCLEANDCNLVATNCFGQAEAWGNCTDATN